MKVKIACGKEWIEINIPDRAIVLEKREMNPIEQVEERIAESLEEPIESAPLKEIAKGKRDACVVISDVTRPVPNSVILPPLLHALEDGGINRDRIRILIATGMHRPNLGEELRQMVGDYVFNNYEILNHYSRREKDMEIVDEIEGTPIGINRVYLEAELKILTGLIEPHFYAGFSGGRKSIVPGISSFETMKFMHSFSMIDHPNVRNCLLDGNPFHEYALRITEKVGADFILNVVIDRYRRISGIFSGHFNRAHIQGCKMVEEYSTVRLNKRVDMVISSGGGYPLDATFYQISKALICARDILKKGGTIVILCECREGFGSREFINVLRSASSPEEFYERYSDPKKFVIDQWCAQNIFQAIEHAGSIYVYSPNLSEEDLGHLGIKKIENIQDTLDRLIPEHEDIVVIPEGPYVVGMVQDS